MAKIWISGLPRNYGDLSVSMLGDLSYSNHCLKSTPKHLGDPEYQKIRCLIPTIFVSLSVCPPIILSTADGLRSLLVIARVVILVSFRSINLCIDQSMKGPKRSVMTKYDICALFSSSLIIVSIFFLYKTVLSLSLCTYRRAHVLFNLKSN